MRLGWHTGAACVGEPVMHSGRPMPAVPKIATHHQDDAAPPPGTAHGWDDGGAPGEPGYDGSVAAVPMLVIGMLLTTRACGSTEECREALYAGVSCRHFQSFP